MPILCPKVQQDWFLLSREQSCGGCAAAPGPFAPSHLGAHSLSWCFSSQCLICWPDFPMATMVAGMRLSLRGGALSFVEISGHSSALPFYQPLSTSQVQCFVLLLPQVSHPGKMLPVPHWQGWRCPSALWDAPSPSSLCVGQQALWEEGRLGSSGLHPQLGGGPCHIQHLLHAPQQQHQGSALLPLGMSLWAIGGRCRGSCCVAKSISRSSRSKSSRSVMGGKYGMQGGFGGGSGDMEMLMAQRRPSGATCPQGSVQGHF